MPTPEEMQRTEKVLGELKSNTLGLREDMAKTLARIQPEDIEAGIIANKELRRDLDAQLQKLKGLPKSRNRAIAITHLEDVIMRLGMDMKEKNELRETPQPGPYPSSYDPSNAKVEPTADGLKL